MNEDMPDDDRTVARPVPGGGANTQPAPVRRDDSGNALPLGTYLDEFELRSVAGEGGFSIVYRAWDHSLKRQVAVKEYFPSGMVARTGGTQVVVRSERHSDAFEAGLKSFVEEARLLAQFDHPALIKVYRFWKANGSAYMVMPFCEGITLREDWRSKPEPPDEASLMGLLDPLTEALAVLHAERWYHRDIAPDNVMLLAGTRRPLLLDFGAARQVIGDMTHALTVILKPGYAPIEQWGEVPGMKQGPWTDVYALAAMVHFGITRQTPPPSVGRLINDGYVPLVQAAQGRYSERFLGAIDHALAVRPEHRTQTIEQFRDEIGLNDFQRERTMTWMPPAGATTTLRSGPTVMGARTELDTGPGASATPSEPSLFTERRESPLPNPLPGPSAAAAPQPARGRNPVVLFGAALAVTGALGGIGYVLLKPSAPTPPLAQVGPAPAPAPASAVAPAPAPAAPAPAPSAPAAGFDPRQEFARVVASQSAGRKVDVTVVRNVLRSGKDNLAFTVTSNHDGYLFVLARTSDGALLQIYPHKTSGDLRVRKGVPLDLPTGGDKLGIDGPSGQNDLLVMVADHKRDHKAFVLRQEGGFTFFRTGKAAEELAAAHTGPLPWVAGNPVCPKGVTCADEFGAAIATFETVQ